MNKTDFLAGRCFTIPSDDCVYSYHEGTGKLSKNNYLAFDLEAITDNGFLVIVDLMGKRRSAWVNFKDLKPCYD